MSCHSPHDTALTDSRLVLVVSSFSLGIDFESVVSTSSEVSSSWVDYKLVNLQNEQTGGKHDQKSRLVVLLAPDVGLRFLG